MTNPTPPLTAEETVVAILDAAVIHHPLKDDDFLYNPEKAVEIIEAYAAQQNVELVATISQLNSDIAGLKAQLKDAEINFEALADGTIRDQAIGMLRAENERLQKGIDGAFKEMTKAIKAQVVLETEIERLKANQNGSGWQPIETAPKDGTSFDVWSENIGFRRTGISWRTPDEDERPWRDRREAAFRDQDGYKVTFKHWMPEPQPPKEST